MSKKPMTWMDVIREQLAKLRSEGKTPSIGDVTPYAKKEWAEIKSGKHPLYVQASNKGKSMSISKSISKGKSKTMKKGKGSKHMSSKHMSSKRMKTQKIGRNQGVDPKMFVKQMLTKVHLCKKDTAKICKYLNSQKGGDCNTCMNSGGGAEPSTQSDESVQTQMGGKGRRKGKGKGKGMKGGEKENFIQEEEVGNGLEGSEEAGSVEVKVDED
jgi:hypothetical protein